MRIAEVVEDLLEALSLRFSHASPNAFAYGRDKSTRGGFLSQNEPRGLAKNDLYVARGGRVGYALDPNKDLQNVYNNSRFGGGGTQALVHAIKNGASTLDAYDGFLPRLYKQHGFVVTGRLEFNPEFAPAGWDYKKDGSPDVVFMVYNGGPRHSIERRVGSFPRYIPKKEGQYFDSYDEAKLVQRDAATRYNRIWR